MPLLTTGRGPDAALSEALEARVAATIAQMRQARVVERMWEGDPSLWKTGDPDHAAIIRNRLGWLTSVDTMDAAELELISFAEEVAGHGFTDAVLLGMGGSSLAPEVFSKTFGHAEGSLRLHVLDTTDPVTIHRLRRALDLEKTLFIVASKSGTTIESLSLFRYFWNEVGTERGADEGPGHFVVITDPATPLATVARERDLRRLFLNPPDIGGRYSALSYFGMVPAALMGVDIPTLFERALSMVNSTRDEDPYADNSPLWLGVVLGEAARMGRDKLTLLLPPAIESFGYWIEQLIAESTGKEGRGILPVEGEPLPAAEAITESEPYGGDRLFVHLHVEELEEASDLLELQVRALAETGAPVVRLWLKDTYDLGAEMWRWEFATAVAAMILGINPFDEPNVTESKRNTSRLLDSFRRDGALPASQPDLSSASIDGYGPAAQGAGSLRAAFRRFFAELEPGEYLAIMAYVERTPETEAALDEIRALIRDRFGVATTSGYGPRFLHSTGQYHKGGPPVGNFLQITADSAVDVPIPGEVYTFRTLIAAQAAGDLEALERRQYPALRLHIRGDVAAGMQEIVAAMRQAVTAQ